ncbi:MAG: TetR family transcriptional regulator, partial [Vicinamibacterales bacterium]|nr:TetR family transcriptional regulator [Vicinamibacterales bacterium]
MRQRIRSYATSAYCETILDAAERLFVESGYHEARMSDLARAAGVSVGTLADDAADLPVLDRVLRTNVVGMAQTLQPFVAAMKARGSGRLVGIA